MTRIGLLSDTHNFLDKDIFLHFEGCDEIWHAGDFGTKEISDSIIKGPWKKPIVFRAVYGNIDGPEIRNLYPEQLFFKTEEVNVYMQHIGGYPGRYANGVKDGILQHQSKLFISGHSHILKIMYDKETDCLHMNPGAAGKQGWHKIRTLIRFVIHGSEMKDCEVIELNQG